MHMTPSDMTDITKDTQALKRALDEYNKAVAAYLKQIEIHRMRYSIKQSFTTPSI